jgi:hypothetical protein
VIRRYGSGDLARMGDRHRAIVAALLARGIIEGGRRGEDRTPAPRARTLRPPAKDPN